MSLSDPGLIPSSCAIWPWDALDLGPCALQLYLKILISALEVLEAGQFRLILRCRPCKAYPWDGVGDVRPFGMMENKVVEGVY